MEEHMNIKKNSFKKDFTYPLFSRARKIESVKKLCVKLPIYGNKDI